MSEKANYRADRIERLLHELQYEMTRGMMENEIDEDLVLRFIVPVSRHFKDGAVVCEFRSRPVPRYGIPFEADPPKFSIIRGKP